MIKPNRSQTEDADIATSFQRRLCVNIRSITSES